eukprot:2826406-Prymnesium_polylepis.1
MLEHFWRLRTLSDASVVIETFEAEATARVTSCSLFRVLYLEWSNGCTYVPYLAIWVVLGGSSSKLPTLSARH